MWVDGCLFAGAWVEIDFRVCGEVEILLFSGFRWGRKREGSEEVTVGGEGKDWLWRFSRWKEEEQGREGGREG